MILHATDKAGSKRPVIGSGPYTYEVFHDWGEVPVGLQLHGNTHGVCQDEQGQLHLHPSHGARGQPDSRHDGGFR